MNTKRNLLMGGLALALLIPGRMSAAGFFIEAGDILAAHYLGNKIVRINPQSGGQLSLGDFTGPADVDVTLAGDLYIGELGGAIKRLTLTNGVITLVNPASVLTSVRGLTLGPNGDLFVTGRSNTTDVVMRVNPATGAETLITLGNQLSLPTGIEVLDANNLVVASFLTSKVVKVSLLDGSQTVLASGGVWIDQPWGLAVSGGYIYAGHYDSKHLNQISVATGAISLLGAAPGWPYGLGIDLDGNLLVGAAGNVGQQDMLVRFSPQGTVLATFDIGLRQQISGLVVAPIRYGEPPVNYPPTLLPIEPQAVNEGALLSFPVLATDSNLPPQTLVFDLEPGAPAGATLSPDGLFAWTPAETNGPGTYSITVRVTDDGVPRLSDTNRFTVVVQEVNAAPVLEPIGVRNVTAANPLVFDILAHDADWPVQSLVFHLEPGGAPGATLTPGGTFSWTPMAELAGSTNTFTVWVEDNGTPPRATTNALLVVVHETNTPPVLDGLGPRAVDEGILLTFAITATDTNRPAQTLSYRLGANAPAGSQLSADGIFAWTPAEIQGPGTYAVTVIVTDDGLPPLAATNSFPITVHEANAAPVIQAVADQTAWVGEPLGVTLLATDPDVPAQTLTFGLAAAAPTGATLSPEGVFTWTPDYHQAATTNVIAVRAWDSGTPSLAATQTFAVGVQPLKVIEAGDLMVANFSSNSVVKIQPGTGAQESLGWFIAPTDLALSTNGLLYVSERGGMVKALDVLHGTTTILNPWTLLTEVWGLTLGPNGDLFVTCSMDDSVVRINPVTGEEVVLTQGNLLSGPYGIDVLDDQHLVVSSAFNNRLVSVALADGTQSVLAEENGLNFPWGVTVAGSNVYVASYGLQMLEQVDNGMVLPVYWVASGLPSGLAVTGDGNLITSVGGLGINQLVEVSPQGTVVQTYSGGDLGEVVGVEVAAFRVGPALPPNHPPVPAQPVLERSASQGTKQRVADFLGSDPDGDPLTLSALDPTSLHGGTVSRVGDWVAYMPLTGYLGDDTFGFTVSDDRGGASAGTATVQVRTNLEATYNLLTEPAGGGAVRLRGDGIPGRTYSVEFTENLTTPIWQRLALVAADATGAFEYLDSPPAGAPPRFYRAIEP